MVVVQQIEGVKLTIQIAGNPITFDSTNPTTANNALAEFFKALVGSEFKLTLDKDYKVIKVEGRDDFLKKLTQANQQMEPLLKKILSEEGARSRWPTRRSACSPPKAVAKGETWTRESKLSLGPIGGYKSSLQIHLRRSRRQEQGPRQDQGRDDPDLRARRPTPATGSRSRSKRRS